MGRTLTLAELKKMAVAKEMPLGITEAVFDKIEYKVDEDTMEAEGCRAYFEGFLPIYIPFINGEIPYQLVHLLGQLGIESYDPEEVNKLAGTKVKVSRYLKETEKVYSKEEYKEFLKKYDGNPPTYIEVNETNDGAILKSVFTNTNFNLKTIKE